MSEFHRASLSRERSSRFVETPQNTGATVPKRKAQMEAQGRHYVETASDALDRCRIQCDADGFPFPDDLYEAHRVLRAHLHAWRTAGDTGEDNHSG